MTFSWTVLYKDGSTLHQYDKTSPHFIAEAGEVPYRAIEFDRAKELLFESAEVEIRMVINPIPEGSKLSLRSRHFRTQDADGTLAAYMIVQSKAGEEVSDESVEWVVYWFPTGVVHECEHFNCPDVANYASKYVHGMAPSLMPETNNVKVEVIGQIE